MTAQEFTRTMTFLCNAYRQEMTDTQVSVWYNFFRDLPLERFNLAIVRIIEKDRYFPTIAEIRQELAMIENPNLQLDAAEEWAKVTDAIRYYGTYRADEAIASMNPVTAAVVKRMGGFGDLCRAEDVEWRRKSFMSIFKETLDRQKEIASFSRSQLTEAEKKRNELIQKAIAMIGKETK